MNSRWIPLACLLACAAAQAELAGPPLPGATPAASAPTWRQWQSQQAGGVRVDEYAGVDGRVFAVAWQGPVKPDLQALLGSRFGPYVAQAGRPRGPGAAHVRGADLAVSSSGHMGAFEGAAWIPSRLPAGFELGARQ